MLNILRFPDFPIYFTGLLLTQGKSGNFQASRESQGDSGNFQI